ncbi:phosphonate ABC transporter ATP-binding protein [Sporolactobacillus sp. CPB3-1]|uniref:Phosphonate ABC transporter ATP-binding protein n=1 Tax=Sporolactobacillus mangiferae TaxID=2940498 RepID=A0ABT0MBA8_9BACL|nr:phosphonate ABC transporter ATP-binding protein [Sporolactobacillus mangiferae]MCL1632156.1 phosphonate ABC transporter ATP-binding protein [Sporolactobacillus mangiferae]
MTTLLEMKHVSKKYGNGTVALSDVNFSVNEGEFVSVIGPSGAGKSTLLRCINKMIQATDGEVIFDSVNISGFKGRSLRKLRTKIGMIFQNYNLVERLSVIENVLHGRLGYKSMLSGSLGLFTNDEKQQAYHLLEMLGLKEQIYQRCDQLSGGQKQRVGIARALIQNPKLMLCDEPIASLDPSSAKTIMDHLKNISDSLKITVLINLHQVDIAMNYADRIIGVSKGQIVFNGAPSQLTSGDIKTIYGSDASNLMINIENHDRVKVAEK